MNKTIRRTFSLLTLITLCLAFSPFAEGAEQPNIVIIYGDDIGFGDFGCYGAKTIPTPHIDQLAEQGARFTSAYCSSATCTPSRYSMLTGEYAWRKKGTGILPPNGSAIIKPGKATIATQLKEAGYATAVIGKWHLGLGNPPKPNWSSKIAPGPREIGFDYSFLLPTTNDRVPCVYVENHHIVGMEESDPVDVFNKNPDGQPSGKTHRDTLRMDWAHGHNNSIVNGIGRIGFMTGGKNALWIDEDISDVLIEKTNRFIKKNQDRPFFLYFSSQAIHVPRTPHARFVGATPHGPRGDAVVEFDFCVGEIVRVLKERELFENTLILITSDNGPVLNDGYRDEAVTKLGDHKPAGPYRGGKYSNFEGGTRVPLVVSWPAQIQPMVSDAMISQVDFPASLHTLSGAQGALVNDDMPDSLDLSATIVGVDAQGRDYIIEHAGSLSIRKGDWKYIAPTNKPRINKNNGTELGNSKQPQLYNVADDPGETANLADQYPDKVESLKTLLNSVKNGSGERALNSVSL